MPLDLEPIKKRQWRRIWKNSIANYNVLQMREDADALIERVEELEADAKRLRAEAAEDQRVTAAWESELDRKDEVISRAMRLCEQERASMTLSVLRTALSENNQED